MINTSARFRNRESRSIGERRNELAVLRRAGTEFERKTAAVSPDQLRQPTAYEEWTVRDLINHVVAESVTSVQLLDGVNAEEMTVGLDDDVPADDATGAFAKAASGDSSLVAEGAACGTESRYPTLGMIAGPEATTDSRHDRARYAAEEPLAPVGWATENRRASPG